MQSTNNPTHLPAVGFWCLRIQSGSGLEPKSAENQPQRSSNLLFWAQPCKPSEDTAPRVTQGTAGPWHTPGGECSLNAKGWASIDVPAAHTPFLTLTDPKGSGWSSISSFFSPPSAPGIVPLAGTAGWSLTGLAALWRGSERWNTATNQ